MNTSKLRVGGKKSSMNNWQSQPSAEQSCQTASQSHFRCCNYGWDHIQLLMFDITKEKQYTIVLCDRIIGYLSELTVTYSHWWHSSYNFVKKTTRLCCSFFFFCTFCLFQKVIVFLAFHLLRWFTAGWRKSVHFYLTLSIQFWWACGHDNFRLLFLADKSRTWCGLLPLQPFHLKV